MSDAVVREPKRVLIVDDEPTVLAAIAEYLTAYGFAVDGASEREEAEALLLTYLYDLVIADMRLTGIHGREGLEVLNFVRERQASTRVVLVTGFGSRELSEEARRRGADAFLEKPLPLSHLASVAFRLLDMPDPYMPRPTPKARLG